MKFEFYVLNENFNKREIINFNIFSNWEVQEETEKCIKKYLRAPKKYKYETFALSGIPGNVLYGFEALCADIKHIIKWQEWSRCEYEIIVGSLFEDDINKFEKVDCYMQALPNIEIIVRECIYQYKKQIKESKV